MRIKQRSACALAIILLGAFVSCATPSNAEPWPQRMVRFIVPLPPGASTDLVARLFAEKLSERWRQPVVVENRQGGDGIPAVTQFLGARDNHTLLFSFAGIITINPLIYEKLPYDLGDLVPVAWVADNFIGIAVPATLNVNSLDDFVKLARSQPGKLNWAASPGVPHYVFAALQKSAAIEMVQISYRDFRPALQDVGEGRIQAVATGVALLLPQVHAGKVKLLMVNNRQRSPQVPEVPTAAEAGYPDLTFEGAVGLYGGRDMPTDLRERIATDIRLVATDPAIAARVANMGSGLRVGTPAEFAAAIEEQRAKIAAIARAMKPTQRILAQ
jgi:tripartite-type tricarboxylate transporter receptor subunit TctC